MNRFRAYNLARSFYCAARGVLRSLKNERNLRIHFFAAAYILYFSRYYSFTTAEYAVLFLTAGLVIACELINTAIEAAVDLYVKEYDVNAKIAKDAAAGAVLVSAAVSVAVGVALFWDPVIMAGIGRDMLKAPLVWLFALALTLFLIIWPEAASRRRQDAP